VDSNRFTPLAWLYQAPRRSSFAYHLCLSWCFGPTAAREWYSFRSVSIYGCEDTLAARRIVVTIDHLLISDMHW